MATTVSVGSIAPVLVTTAGSVNDRLTVTFPSAPRSTGTIYYGPTSSVSSTNNTGSLAPGTTLTMDRQQFYFIAALDANGKNASGLISYFPPVNEEQPLIPGALVRLNGSAIETSTDHGTTWVAAQAPGVATTIFQSVDALSGTPRSVTDWGPLLNTAMASGVRNFLFGPFDYPFTTTINGNGLSGLVFRGSAGQAWGDPGAATHKTRLVWGGTGAGLAVDFTNILNGPVVEDIIWLYSSSSFTGNYLSLFNSAIATFRRCFFGSTSPGTVKSAACAVALDKVVGAIFEECTFGNGPNGTGSDFLAAVRGREPAGGGYSNVVRFYECIFQGGVNAGVINPDLDWLFDHCVFELFNLPPNKPYITTDFTYGDLQVTLNNCAYWDALGADAQYVVKAPAGNTWQFAAVNCVDHNSTGALAKLYDFSACNGSIVIEGGNTLNVIDVGDASVAGVKKSRVKIEGLEVTSAGSKTDRLLGINTGHIVVDVNVSVPTSASFGPSYQTTTVSHERALRFNQPSIAAHTGVLNHDFVIVGSDMAGMVILHNNGVGVGATGLIADITLEGPPASPGFGAGVAAGSEFVLTEIWPLTIDDAGNGWVTPNMATTYACQPYAYSKTLARSGSQASFSIGVNVGIPAGSYIGVGYRTIHL